MTSGSGLGKGSPVADEEFASLIISEDGNRAKDAIVCTVFADSVGDVDGMRDVLGVVGVGEVHIES